MGDESVGAGGAGHGATAQKVRLPGKIPPSRVTSAATAMATAGGASLLHRQILHPDKTHGFGDTMLPPQNRECSTLRFSADAGDRHCVSDVADVILEDVDQVRSRNTDSFVYDPPNDGSG